MNKFLKTSLAGVLTFGLSLAVCMGFMTASVPVEYTAAEQALGAARNADEGEWPVIVIDAGHGGFDGGAEAADGTQEKDINLAIAEKLAEQAKGYEVNIVMTRDGDYGLYEPDSSRKKQEDLTNRKKLMEESGADLAVSIHLNSFPQDASVYGAQVFYAESEQEGTDVPGAREIAENVQKALETGLPDGRERTAMKKDDVLLMKEPPCSFILVECGFLSCPQEAEKLKTAEYQGKAAEAVWAGIHEILCFEVKEILPVIDSTNR